MTLLDYLMSIRHLVGDFNIEEDHRRKNTVIRTSKALTEEQKIEVSYLCLLPPVYIVKGAIL